MLVSFMGHRESPDSCNGLSDSSLPMSHDARQGRWRLRIKWCRSRVLRKLQICLASPGSKNLVSACNSSHRFRSQVHLNWVSIYVMFAGWDFRPPWHSPTLFSHQPNWIRTTLATPSMTAWLNPNYSQNVEHFPESHRMACPIVRGPRDEKRDDRNRSNMCHATHCTDFD